MSIKAVIFDLDGTITQPFFDFDAIRQEMGLGPDSGPVWEAIGQMSEQQRVRAENILNFHEQRAVTESQLNHGARETLENIRQAGIGIGILTRNRAGNALAVAKKHNLQFDVVIGREEGPVKPDAFGVLEICRRLAVKPFQAVVVGDYLYDVLSARAAGAISVLLANHKRAEEFAQHADFKIENLKQILEIIQQQNS
ncbi:MAG TPA: HAD family hydrolase [Sedimentisphaerales bacterium]|nr:HAD family hydrolase [Sedimentisphaerales bacterium]